MKVYKRNPLDMDLAGIEGLLLPALGVLILLFLAFLFLGGSSPNVVTARLVQNPLSLSANDSTVLQVQVSNPTSQMAQDMIVQVTAPSAPKLSITPKRQTIPFLGSNETRTLEFLVLPVDAASDPFTPGSYSITISTQLQGEPYTTQVKVQVVK
ncbi:MAG: hypothetical protein IPJ89_04290 [Candidatus Iainarchaeum archaeon]|uniref:Uncharacterized protein n=1 Tax=Candidatus Iainarchaeum sp. TaxID=3101447 RepID=A0A7T9I250_9ARCH|nr:MAG: hypothetical protein IPJ89_04290 [Candidatus Diapherotrites archaeon]